MLLTFVAAILLTLNNLLEKIPTLLKPFLPQLQRTFAKSLADTSSEVLRSRAAKALGTLITLTPRIDPLIAGRSPSADCLTKVLIICRTRGGVQNIGHWGSERNASSALRGG